VLAVAGKNHYIASFKGVLDSLQPQIGIVGEGDPNGKGLGLPEPMGSTNSLKVEISVGVLLDDPRLRS
jgi:hypothetical protein